MPVLVGDSVVELSVDEALDDEVMVTKVVGVGVADVDDEESDEGECDGCDFWGWEGSEDEEGGG